VYLFVTVNDTAHTAAQLNLNGFRLNPSLALGKAPDGPERVVAQAQLLVAQPQLLVVRALLGLLVLVARLAVAQLPPQPPPPPNPSATRLMCDVSCVVMQKPQPLMTPQRTPLLLHIRDMQQQIWDPDIPQLRSLTTTGHRLLARRGAADASQQIPVLSSREVVLGLEPLDWWVWWLEVAAAVVAAAVVAAAVVAAWPLADRLVDRLSLMRRLMPTSNYKVEESVLGVAA
jgi:hypothetical protein